MRFQRGPLGTGLEAICVNSGQEPSCILLVSWEREGCRIQKQWATLFVGRTLGTG